MVSSSAEKVYSTYPVHALHARWRVSAQADLVGLLTQASEELSPIRLSKINATAPSVRVSLRPPKKVKIVKLKRGEYSDRVILDATEKRNVVEAQCARVVSRLMRLGTEQFWKASEILESTLTAFLLKIDDHAVDTSGADETADAGITGSDVGDPSCDDLSGGGDDFYEPGYASVAIDVDSSDDEEEDEESQAAATAPLDMFADIDMRVFTDSQVSSLHLSQAADFLSQSMDNPSDEQFYEPIAFPHPSPAPASQGAVRFPARSPSRIASVQALADAIDNMASVGTTWGMQPPCVTDVATPPRGSERALQPDGRAQPDTPSSRTRSKRKADDDESRDGMRNPPAVKRIHTGILAQYKLPHASTGVTRNSKQLEKVVRLAASPPQCGVAVGDFARALRNIPLREVGGLLARYPVAWGDENLHTMRVHVVEVVPHSTYTPPTYVLTREAVDVLVAAVRTKCMEDGRPERGGMGYLADEPQYIASFVGIAEQFTEETVSAFVSFYEAKTQYNKFAKDRDWLKSPKNWASLLKTHTAVEFLTEDDVALGGNAAASTTDVNTTEVERLLAATRDGLEALTLATVIASQPADPLQRIVRVSVPEILGRISGDTWLNDTVVYLSLCTMAAPFADVTIFDPLQPQRLPSQTLRDQRVVIFPVNVARKHWCALYVLLDWHGQHNVFVYDPQCKPTVWGEGLESAWSTWARPMLEAWHDRDVGSSNAGSDSAAGGLQPPSLGAIHRETVLQPKQTDSSNCGVFCLGVAYCYIQDQFELQDLATISPSRLKLMRLRILHLLIAKSRLSADDDQQELAARTVASFGSFGVVQVRSQGRKQKKKV